MSSVALSANTGGNTVSSVNYLNSTDTITATVTTSEAATVVTSGGTPKIVLNIGGTLVDATYLSGSGTTSLLFKTAALANTLNDANGVGINANVTLNGGTIKDAAGNDLTLTFSAVTDNTAYVVDNAAPAAASTPITYASTNTAGGNFTLQFGEALSSLGTPSIADAASGSSSTAALGTAVGSLAANGLSVLFTKANGTFEAGDIITLTGAADLAGNTANLTFTLV